jgi:hypothetical protein
MKPPNYLASVLLLPATPARSSKQPIHTRTALYNDTMSIAITLTTLPIPAEHSF